MSAPISSTSFTSSIAFNRKASPELVASLANANVWRAGELGIANSQTVDTGYVLLNQALPGGGWPEAALVEVIQPQAGLYEWGLVAPAIAMMQSRSIDSFSRSGDRLWVLIGAPYLPFGPALGARQINMQGLLCVHAGPGQAPTLLWATREALQCADVAGVLAWLPDARSAHLRRLQIAAHTHNKLLFVFRPLRALQESSPAPLRLRLEGAIGNIGGSGEGGEGVQSGNLRIHVVKRRGPPLALPVLLETWPIRLSALLAASRERVRHQRKEAIEKLTPVSASTSASSSSISVSMPSTERSAYALLDRVAHLNHH